MADGAGIEAIGYGDISIKTTICTVQLHDVWYTPKLACRLISTAMLNDRGVSIHLENRRLKAFKNHGLLFEGTVKGGLYYVDQPKEQALTTIASKPYVTNTRAL